MRGMTLSVARPANFPDCTAGGISSSHNRLTLVGWLDTDTGRAHPMPPEAQMHEPNDQFPPVLLKVRSIGGRILSIIPADDEGQPLPGWFMAGGNYACWSDSRISDLARKLVDGPFYGAVAIHDRQEEYR